MSRSVTPLCPQAATRALVACIALAAACSGADPSEPRPGPQAGLEEIVDSIRAAYGLPALGGAIVTVDAAESAIAVAGVRRVAGGSAATAGDLWHLGSNFKAFTAMLAATAVDQGEIEWSTTLAEAFPELEGTMREEYRDVTLRDVLSHRAGLPRDPAAQAISGQDRAAQRLSVTAWAVTQPPASAYGTYSYTNTGYMVAAAMLERAMDESFEDAMASRIFTPLGIADAGFGPQDAAGGSAQPVGHRWQGGQWVAVERFDNPPVYASAGGAHMSIGSWARFLQEVLRLEAGEPTIVSVEAGQQTTSAVTPMGGDNAYGMGWVITSRSWAGGKTLTHDGTNTANSSVTWMAPLRGFAVLAVTNAYDGSQNSRTWRALDALSARLITYHQTGR
jgi:CubicO group peptidase (beta-lactamase class C family)